MYYTKGIKISVIFGLAWTVCRFVLPFEHDYTYPRKVSEKEADKGNFIPVGKEGAVTRSSWVNLIQLLLLFARRPVVAVVQVGA